METGNPKQLATLAIVAVGAFGFLFSRLGGKSLPPITPSTTLDRRDVPNLSARLFTLVNDPFSHPKLASVETKTEAPVRLAAKPPKPMKGFPDMDPLPVPGMTPPESNPMEPPPPVATVPKAAAPSAVTIGLEAIAGASDAMAFLTVGGAESQAFHPNDRIRGAIRLLRIEDGSVVLSGPKGEFSLDVGERKSL